MLQEILTDDFFLSDSSSAVFACGEYSINKLNLVMLCVGDKVGGDWHHTGSSERCDHSTIWEV